MERINENYTGRGKGADDKHCYITTLEHDPDAEPICFYEIAKYLEKNTLGTNNCRLHSGKYVLVKAKQQVELLKRRKQGDYDYSDRSRKKTEESSEDKKYKYGKHSALRYRHSGLICLLLTTLLFIFTPSYNIATDFFKDLFNDILCSLPIMLWLAFVSEVCDH